MSHVVFELDGVELWAECGARLLDVLDDAPQPLLPVRCRAGNCGSCRVRVLEGAPALAQPTAAEREELAQRGAAPDERLGCQLRLSDRPPLRRVRLQRV